VQIYAVGGTCGAAQDLYYSHTDSESLVNGTQYSYRVTASAGLYISDTVIALFVDAGNEDVFLYPNPATGAINVTIDNTYVPPFLIEIFTAEGRQLNTAELVYTNSFQISSGKLPDDMYIVKITTSERVTFSKQILFTR
jgi:hypothetical protein